MQVNQPVVAHVTLDRARGVWHTFATLCVLQDTKQVAVEGTALARMPALP